MKKRNDSDYYAERAIAEREAAASATCDEARNAHLSLARFYEQRLAISGAPVPAGNDPSPIVEA